MKRTYIQPMSKEVLLAVKMHFCDGSIDTNRIGPNGETIRGGDEAPARAFDWDEDDDY